jgi:7,8-dihydro-6-hydroxymethylpterin dimethyltransferase
MRTPEQILATTESVCPICLQRVAAKRMVVGDDIYLVKTCPDHGDFRTIVWRGLDSYRRWGERGSRAATPPVTETAVAQGCPHDCGLCPDHRQQSCCVLLEVTQRCNLRCPVCFASSAGAGDDPDITEIESWLRLLKAHGNPVNVQLSGGEPTVRDDLPEIVALTHAQGFDFVQINTNGVRLAKEPGYARRLADAGLDCAFLQFDGVSDETYRRIRGARLFDLKQQAVAQCADAGIGVVLVPTLVPGVNVDEIGAIIEFARDHAPAVRAVHFQPVSYFGRYPTPPADCNRITLPEVMAEVERQTGGMIRTADFAPGSAENAYCSFSGKFFVGDDKRLRAAAPASSSCCSTSSGCGCGLPSSGDDAQHARRVVAGQWAARQAAIPKIDLPGVDTASFDAFLADHRYSLSISGMAFQDAWTLDLERLRECFIHVVSPDRRIIPFCAYNLTTAAGDPLYRACT